MAYLKTVITYNVPAEAEVDKSYLEAHGLVVGLLNANTSRNELGAPFYIQLQVSDEDYERAVALLREANPSRFGSAARVAELDRGIRQAVLRFFLWGIPAGIIGAWAAPASDLKPLAGFGAAIFVGAFAMMFKSHRSPSPKDKP